MDNCTSVLKKNEALVRLSRITDDKGKVDVTVLSEEDRNKCREITRGITSIDQLHSFGTDIANARNEASNQLLEMSKLDKAGKIGEYVEDVMAAIRESEYEDPSKMTGFRGFVAKYVPFGKDMVKAGDKYVVSRYETSKDVVDKILVALQQQQVDLKSDHNTLDNMLVKTKSYIEQLGICYVALAQLYQDKKDELEEMKRKNDQDPGTYSEEEIMEASKFLDEIDRHGYELFLAGQYNSHVIIPSIIKMKDNATALISNAEQISKTVIPNWEMSIAMALINKRAQAAVDVQKMVKDTNNRLMVANAEMLKKVTITLEKESRRGAFDIESYKKSYETCIEALRESAENARIAKEERAKNMAELVKINRDNAMELDKISQNLKKHLFYDGEQQGAQLSDSLK